MPELTTTSYAILGLLAVRSWTTYELAQQMQRSLSRYWPRAESVVYEEPKRLATVGLAKARKGRTGKRPKTVYSITAKGRRALAAWLDEPGAGPVLEFEALLKALYADHGSMDGLRANVAAVRAVAEDLRRANATLAREYLETGGPFPERLPLIGLTGMFQVELAAAMTRWAEWAGRTVAAWDDVVGAPVPEDAFEAAIRAAP